MRKIVIGLLMAITSVSLWAESFSSHEVSQTEFIELERIARQNPLNKMIELDQDMGSKIVLIENWDTYIIYSDSVMIYESETIPDYERLYEIARFFIGGHCVEIKGSGLDIQIYHLTLSQ